MLRTVILLVVVTLISSCSSSDSPTSEKQKVDLIIYSGITMVRPLNELVREFEAKNNVNIELKQGASGYLYKAIKTEHKGDIFFPGSNSYRLKNKHDGFLKDHVFVGYNRLAIVVAKGNPKHITNDLKQLTNPDYSVVLSAPESGAVGKNAKAVLDKQGLTGEVYDNVTFFTTDSHRIFNAIKDGQADIALNWFATTKWPETEDYMDAILLPESIAKPKRLELNLLSFSSNPELAKKFMAFASSKHGLETFAEYGFLTNQELTQAIANINNKTDQARQATDQEAR
ncbi:molybdate ABC transporter substrate-binding protein [Thiomicrorhabdus sp.]|uniref:molybdate ABC transporter substrate-binding protein n=1 Tax=Thiomicrorhabdus sp. TaxID=2039724 RepID=UPI002AA958A7|nr:molybdate ABC transporter substrate-binding protein [Thiomicrorhabdus sp.]